jgi:protease I
MNQKAIEFIRHFLEAGKPLGVICHGPQTMIETGMLRGRTMTSYPSIKTDLINAGVTWVDREVVVDNGLVSSRSPKDLDAFNRKLLEELAEGVHALH